MWDKYRIRITCIYKTGKHEKSAVEQRLQHRKIGAGALLLDAGKMVEILLWKYNKKENSVYQVK